MTLHTPCELLPTRRMSLPPANDDCAMQAERTAPGSTYQSLRRYTCRSDLVINPFSSSSAALSKGRCLEHYTIGIELNPAVIAQTRATLTHKPDRYSAACTLEVGDIATLD